VPGASEIRGRDAVWLLDLDIGGRIYRFASKKVEVVDVAGLAYSYDSGLGELTIGLDDGAATKTVALTLQTGVDWALIKARGQTLELQRGVLRRWFTGQTLERATVVIVGLTEGPQYGAKEDPFLFSLVRSPIRDSKIIPDPQATVDFSTFPRPTTGFSIADKAEGASYPVIIGAPGHNPKAVLPTSAVPALLADFQVGLIQSTLLIADGKIAATSCTLNNATLHNFSTVRTVQSREDNLGRTYSFVDFIGAFPQLGGEGDEYYVGFQDDATYGGGAKHRGKMVRGAGDVIRFLLEEHSNIEYDRGRFEAMADWLNRFKIDGYINAPQQAWSWIETEILRWLQVVPVEGVDGLYLTPVRYGATRQDARMWLSTFGSSRNVKREGPITTIREAIFNEFTFEYRKIRGADKYLDRRILSADPGNLAGVAFPGVTDSRIYASYLCRRSQADYQVRPWRGASGSIWDDTTAGLILQGMAERYAFPKRAARYVGGLELEVLERGDVVLLNDDELHLVDHICLVENRIVSADQVALDLMVIDHPVFERRTL
jgi:hypothetical protein